MLAILCDDDAFAGCQAVGLEDDRKAESVERFSRLGRIRDGVILRGGDLSLYQKVLCENLAALELRRGAAGADDFLAARAEFIHHTRDQRNFWSDYRKIRADSFRNFEGRSGNALSTLRDTWVARRSEHFDSWRLP
jgi:hypothetical protein